MALAKLASGVFAVLALTAVGVSHLVSSVVDTRADGPGAAQSSTTQTAPGPIPVDTASLTQQGQNLVWTVTLTTPFSATGLRAGHRAVCLLLEPPARPSVSVCIAPGTHGIKLLAPGPDKTTATVPATISRTGPTEMSASFPPAAVGLPYRSLAWQVVSALGTTTVEFPSAPERLGMHTPVLVGCIPSGPSEVNAGSGTAHELALTFDDGPWWEPPAIDFVHLFARSRVSATFFEIGEQIPEYDPSGSVERAMLADGDMIGDHTWTHPDMAALSPSEQTSELELTIEAIRKRTGFTPCLWRPPYGDVDPQLVALARRLGLLTVMWSVDTSDYTLPGTAVIVQRVLAGAHNGAIILQHFGGGPRYETFAALPAEIAGLRARGYRLVSVAQLLGLRLIYK